MIAACRPVRPLVFALVLACGLPLAARAGSTVRFDTLLGSFDVELYDESMPNTVANFLSYVNAGAYDSTIFHRTTTYDPNGIQVIQGGGFALSGNTLFPVATNPPILFESGTHTNVRGTIAMARGEDFNSATSQFYFNVQDNPALDGGYAVFGRVAGAADLAMIDLIGSLPRADLSGQLGPVFAETPLIVTDSDAYLMFVNGVQSVPEPSTMVLAAIGLAGAVVVGRRRKAGC